MIINISDLIFGKCNEIPVESNVRLNDINRRDENIRFLEPVSVKGKIFNVDKNIIFSGSLEAVIKVECNRCLDDVVKNISISFDEKIIETDEEEVDDIIADIEKESISLESFLEKLLILKLPMKFLCSDDCKGLCPQCGINLNNSVCNCEKEDIDVRLIKLKDLLK